MVTNYLGETFLNTLKTWIGDKLGLKQNGLTSESSITVGNTTTSNLTGTGDTITVGGQTFKPYYTAGDTISDYTTLLTGTLTTSKTRIYFTLILDRPLVGVSAVTITGSCKVRQCNTYLYESSAKVYVYPTWVATVSGGCIGNRVRRIFQYNRCSVQQRRRRDRNKIENNIFLTEVAA